MLSKFVHLCSYVQFSQSKTALCRLISHHCNHHNIWHIPSFPTSTYISGYGGNIIKYNGISPEISNDAFIASTATIIGDVCIMRDASVWFNCVLRGDVGSIKIGERTNIQDGTVIHVNSAKPHLDIPQLDCIIGNDVTVGHSALLHACIIKDRVFIGMQACIMDGAIIEEDAVIGAGALVTKYKVVKSGEMWTGRPAKFIRNLTEDEKNESLKGAERYTDWSKNYMN